MFNQESMELIKKQQFNKNWLKPSFNGSSFINIFPTIRYLLTKNKSDLSILSKSIVSFCQSKDPQKIIFFLIDACGFNLFKKIVSEHLMYQKFLNNGQVSILTSQFPSTTSACVTTAHTNLSVSQHGLYEWYYRDKILNQVISPLLFSFASDGHQRETLSRAKIDPKLVFPKQNFYQQLQQDGVSSYIFQHQEYLNSAYSKFLYREANIFGFKTFNEGLVNLLKMVKKVKEKSYYFFYFDKIDTLSHQYGPFSQVVKWELNSLLTAFKSFQSLLPNDVLTIVSADHGQTNLDEDKITYLNLEFKEIEQYLERGNDGEILAPAGSPRDFFLYVQDKFLDLVYLKLKKLLRNKALVMKTKTLIEKGFFSQDLSQKFLANLANLVVLPNEHHAVWWYKKGVFEVNKKGHHGGLSQDEMLIPLLII